MERVILEHLFSVDPDGRAVVDAQEERRILIELHRRLEASREIVNRHPLFGRSALQNHIQRAVLCLCDGLPLQFSARVVRCLDGADKVLLRDAV